MWNIIGSSLFRYHTAAISHNKNYTLHICVSSSLFPISMSSPGCVNPNSKVSFTAERKIRSLTRAGGMRSTDGIQPSTVNEPPEQRKEISYSLRYLMFIGSSSSSYGKLTMLIIGWKKINRISFLNDCYDLAGLQAVNVPLQDVRNSRYNQSRTGL